MKIVLVLFAAAYLVVMLGFAEKQYNAVICSGMDIIIRDSLERGLVTPGDVKNIIRLEYPELAGMPITGVDASGIEESLNRFPAISGAQVYSNVQGRLIIELSQRMPVARVEDLDHQHYFLDAQGYVIPAVMDYSPHVLYINGYIPGKYRKAERILNGHDGTEDHTAAGGIAYDGEGLMAGLLKMAVFIHSDPFWKSQIVQLYVKRNGEFELIPRVGSQIILFGDADGIETKFFKLRTLYHEGFSHTGWNQYEMINLKYENQVICTKR